MYFFPKAVPPPFNSDVEHVSPLELPGFAVDAHFGVTPRPLHCLHHLDGGQTHGFIQTDRLRESLHSSTCIFANKMDV